MSRLSLGSCNAIKVRDYHELLATFTESHDINLSACVWVKVLHWQ